MQHVFQLDDREVYRCESHGADSRQLFHLFEEAPNGGTFSFILRLQNLFGKSGFKSVCKSIQNFVGNQAVTPFVCIFILGCGFPCHLPYRNASIQCCG